MRHRISLCLISLLCFGATSGVLAQEVHPIELRPLDEAAEPAEIAEPTITLPDAPPPAAPAEVTLPGETQEPAPPEPAFAPEEPSLLDAIEPPPDASVLTLPEQSSAFEALATPTPGPSSAPSSLDPSASASPKGPLTKADIYRFKLELAESSYRLTPTLTIRAELLGALENLIGLTCLADLHKTLQYEKPPAGNDECLKALTRAEEVYPKSPLVICAKEGIFSEECDTAYQKQRIGRLEANPAPPVDSPAAAEEGSENIATAISRTKSQIEGLQKQIHLVENDTKLDEVQRQSLLKRLYSRAVTTACELHRVRLDRVGGTDENPELQRVRLITFECDSLGNQAREVDDSLPAIPCGRHGLYSVQCIDAIKAVRAAAEPTDTTPAKSAATPDLIGRF